MCEGPGMPVIHEVTIGLLHIYDVLDCLFAVFMMYWIVCLLCL